MKPLIICLILFCCLHHLYAQTNNVNANEPKAPDPPFLNHVYNWQADSLLALEQIEAHMKSKTKVLGFGGSEAGYTMEGERSPFRIKAGDNLRFAIKNGVTMMGDPSMMIRLYRLDSKKGGREAIVSSQGGPYTQKKNTASNEISFNVQKSANDVYIILPVSRLSPGEYGFMNVLLMKGSGTSVSYIFFAFGVD
jgi:hypothetical protein